MTTTSFPLDQIKVVLLENIHPSAVELLGAEGYQVELLRGALKGDELRAKLSEAHVIGVRSKTQVRKDDLAHARRLLTLGCFCIGTNQVDLDEANLRGIPVFNAPFSNTRSVAELVIAEVIALSRHLFDRSSEVHRGIWRKVAEGSREVRGKTLGIVGYGHIGSQVGVMAESMGMRVVFFDVKTKLPMGNNRSVATLSELLGLSDFVTLHVPATPETHLLMKAEQLAAMKPGACLLNLSRGTVVDIAALSQALRDKHVGGAAVDVYPDEPEGNGDDFRSELRGLPNVILTPHVGGSTEEAQEAIGREVATSLIRFVNAGATTGAVNFPQIEMPAATGTHRILNVHRNVPGVLRDINRIVSDLDANIVRQTLQTDAHIGYLVMDLAADVSMEVKNRVSALDTNIRTRVLF